MRLWIATIFLVAVIGSLLADSHFQMGLGVDFPGTQSQDVESGMAIDYDTDLGFSPYVEFLDNVSSHLIFGAGIEYQIIRTFSTDLSRAPGFGFVPIYFCSKYAILTTGGVTPELQANLGYNFLTGNDEYKAGATLKGGFYLAGGIGIVHESGLTVDLLYKFNRGKKVYDTHDGEQACNVTQKNIAMRLGYRF